MDINDTKSFLSFYLITLQQKVFSSTLISMDKLTLFYNLVSNFSCNFKDPSFVALIKRDKELQTVVYNIVHDFGAYLLSFLTSNDQLDTCSYLEFEIFMRYTNLFLNIKESEICKILNIKENQLSNDYELILSKFQEATSSDLSSLRLLLFKKKGFAILDHKGIFGKYIPFNAK